MDGTLCRYEWTLLTFQCRILVSQSTNYWIRIAAETDEMVERMKRLNCARKCRWTLTPERGGCFLPTSLARIFIHHHQRSIFTFVLCNLFRCSLGGEQFCFSIWWNPTDLISKHGRAATSSILFFIIFPESRRRRFIGCREELVESVRLVCVRY